MANAKFGTSDSIIPLYAMVFGSSTARPSTISSMPPNASSRNPVAVTTTSAGGVSPDSSRSPDDVNSAIRSVTTDARPDRIAANRSPSGTRHNRWSHGWYFGLKCVSTSYPGGSSFTVSLRIRLRTTCGRRRDSW